jgi:hypothetical protein
MLAITTHIIPMFLTVVLSHGSTAPNAYQAQTKPSELTIELDQCKAGSFGFPRPLGSEQVVIKGRRKNKCVFRYKREVEGGYTERECRVPISLGSLSMSGGQAYLDNRLSPFSQDVSKYCKVVRQGNIFIDRIKTK